MGIETMLMQMFYDGKDSNDLYVRMRAPIDVFFLLKEIKRLQKILGDHGIDFEE